MIHLDQPIPAQLFLASKSPAYSWYHSYSPAKPTAYLSPADNSPPIYQLLAPLYWCPISSNITNPTHQTKTHRWPTTHQQTNLRPSLPPANNPIYTHPRHLPMCQPAPTLSAIVPNVFMPYWYTWTTPPPIPTPPAEQNPLPTYHPLTNQLNAYQSPMLPTYLPRWTLSNPNWSTHPPTTPPPPQQTVHIPLFPIRSSLPGVSQWAHWYY